MTSGSIGMAVSILAIALFMGVIVGVNAYRHYKRNTPTNFWSGSIIDPKEISDIPAYNRANFLMWTVYLFCLALPSVVAYFNLLIGIIVYVSTMLIGLIIIILVYKRIYNKYKTEFGRYRIEI